MVDLINQETELKNPGPAQFDNVGIDKNKLIQRAAAMQSEYSTWEATHRDLSTYLYPTKGFFGGVTPNQGSRIDHKTLIDEEATLDIDTFASGMMSGFTSPSRPWAKLRFRNRALMQYEPGKLWLEEVQSRMFDYYQISNLYSVLMSMYVELAVFGTACALIEEDVETLIRLYNYTAGEYVLSRDSKGRITGFYRKFYMNVGQLVDKFGLNNCSTTVQEAWRENRPDNWVSVSHMIESNDDRIPYLKDYRNMPYRSLYWENGDKEQRFLRLGGYEEMPVVAPRWEITTNADVYGKGPGWKALGSIKELQRKVKNLLVGLDKVTNPPVFADASVNKVNLMPGGVSRSSAQNPNVGVRPVFQAQIDLGSLDNSIEKTKQKIKKFFFADLFLMMIEADRAGQPITATEIAERQGERVSKLGPILELWQGDEFVKTIIDRTFNIGVRLNAFPEAPPEIAEEDIEVDYVSILAQAQKMTDIQAIDIWVAGVIQDSAVSSGALDLINFDEKNRKKAEMLGIPPSVVNSMDSVLAIRKKRAEDLAQLKTQQAMTGIADAAKKGSGAVKDMASAPMGQDTALDSVLGMLQKIRSGESAQ